MSTYPLLNCHGVPLSALPASEHNVFHRSGVYVMARKEWGGSYTVLYVGQAVDLGDRLGPCHEKWSRALSMGMTHLLINLTATTALQRSLTEAKLIAALSPPLNKQVPTLASLLPQRRGFGAAMAGR